MEQQNTNFIKLGGTEGAPNVDGTNIFNELGGDLDFGATRQDAVTSQKTNWLEVWFKVSNTMMVLCIVLAVLMTIDIQIKSSEDNSLLNNVPGCEFLSTYGIDEYQNTTCLTVKGIIKDVTEKTTKLQSDTVKNLAVLLRLRFQLVDIKARPDVQFIQEHTSNARINIVDMLADFEDTKKSSDSNYGSMIKCQPTLADEKGNLQVTCDTFGDRIDSTDSITSRLVASMLIDKLQESSSPFSVLESPKTLELSPYSAVDSVYSTKTSFSLKLKYIPNPKS